MIKNKKKVPVYVFVLRSKKKNSEENTLFFIFFYINLFVVIIYNISMKNGSMNILIM